jgi:hypothetical protein
MSLSSLVSSVDYLLMMYALTHGSPDSGDADKSCDLMGLLWCACLTMLSSIDRVNELRPTSRFLDLALVIGHYLELSQDLPAYGIEGACVA